MTQNLITSAFELVRDVEQGVLLLDTFHRLATREVLPPLPLPLLPCFLRLLPLCFLQSQLHSCPYPCPLLPLLLDR